jgi:hypothetical protein
MWRKFQLRLRHGQPFYNPVMEGLPTIRPETIISHQMFWGENMLPTSVAGYRG